MQLEKAIQYANSSIISKTLIDPSLKGMGTTVSMVTLARHMAFWATSETAASIYTGKEPFHRFLSIIRLFRFYSIKVRLQKKKR